MIEHTQHAPRVCDNRVVRLLTRERFHAYVVDQSPADFVRHFSSAGRAPGPTGPGRTRKTTVAWSRRLATRRSRTAASDRLRRRLRTRDRADRKPGNERDCTVIAVCRTSSHADRDMKNENKFEKKKRNETKRTGREACARVASRRPARVHCGDG